MALTPTSNTSREEDLARRQSLQEEALLREVDDAVRQDDLLNFLRNYGRQLAVVLVLGLGAFGGWLWWQHKQTGEMESHSEELVLALQQVESGNLETANTALVALAQKSGPGVAALARLQQAGIALRGGKTDEAIKLYDAVAGDAEAPQVLRDQATIRSVAAGFDKLDPQVVIDRLKPLATPGNPWFGTAGEMVGMAYLEQGKPQLAGPLFAEISKDEKVPSSLRSRARQMAGLLGVDAIESVDKAIAETADPVANASAAAGQ